MQNPISDLFADETQAPRLNHERLWGGFLVGVLKGMSAKKRASATVTPRTGQFDLLELFEKLGLPLWEDPNFPAPDGSSSHAANDGWNGEWTEEEIYILHEEVLKRTVHVLDDKRTSQKTKDSILDWISKDEDKPFSFRICAIVSGCDPEELRDQIFDLVRRLKRRRLAA
jgi:hypothetical protein